MKLILNRGVSLNWIRDFEERENMRSSVFFFVIWNFSTVVWWGGSADWVDGSVAQEERNV